MAGSTRERHCHRCDRQVHDLAALSRREAEELAHQAEGHLCARLTLRPDGSVVTADRPVASGTLGALVAIALSATPFAHGQGQADPIASVSGTVLLPKAQGSIASAEVIFVRNAQEVSKTVTDSVGKWKAEVPAGTYDVVFRSGALFGERVNSVQLHPGEQEFSAVQETFRFGHLGAVDSAGAGEVLMGEVIGVITSMSFHYAVRHPLSFAALWKRRIVHALVS